MTRSKTKFLMNKFFLCYSFVILLTFSNAMPCCSQEDSAKSPNIIQELNDYWNEVSRTVREGDFLGYSDTCHPKGVLVSGIKQTSYPLQQALQKWKPGFEDTQAKRMKASVDFRFSRRLHDATTAHETGIFRYSTTKNGKEAVEFIHFEGLLSKTPKGWKILMEHQKSSASEADWNQLGSRNAAAR